MNKNEEKETNGYVCNRVVYWSQINGNGKESV